MSDYKPTEYIVDFGNNRSNQFVRLHMAMVERNGARLNEPVVRCRDCKHITRSEAWPDCFNCKRTGLPTDDDMFCAWGERRME